MNNSTQTAAGDLLGASGVPLSLRFDGREHPVSYPTLRVLDRVEKLVVRRAIDAIEELATVLSREEMAAARAELNSMVRAREHATGGRLWAQEFGADGGLRGLQLLLWACMEEGREALPIAERGQPVPFDDMPTIMAESPDAGSVIAQVLPDFTAAVGKKRKIPAAKLQQMMEAAIASVKPA